MQVTCHPRLGGTSRTGGGGHRNTSRPDFCIQMRLLRQTELLHQSFRLRVVAAEVAVDHSLILRTTL